MNSTQPTGDNELRSTGVRFAADAGMYRMPDYDPVTSAHLWIVITTYRIADPTKWASGGGGDGPALLDMENLISVTPVVCLHCEQAYTDELAGDPCDGEGVSG